MQTHAIRFRQVGTRDVLRWEQIQLPPRQTGGALIHPTAMGINFIDIYTRAPLLLARKRSLYVTWPKLGDYATDQVSLDAMSQEFFKMALSGKIRAALYQTYPMNDATYAHDALASRQTT